MTDNIEINEEVKMESIQEHYNHLKLLVDSMESDAIKTNKGNKAAGVRLRKTLRYTKGYLGEFVKFTLGKS
jgi:hypothetical protein